MNHPQSPQWIVVGIDGSDAAINAAKWAASEAISRDIPLRLTCAIPERQADAPAGDDSLDIEYGETALRAACAALHTLGEQIKIETELVHGSPKSVLIDESRDAAMICIGSIGIGQVARRVLGSTADSVAQNAHCPVAVIRSNRKERGITFRIDRCRRRRFTRQRRGARAWLQRGPASWRGDFSDGSLAMGARRNSLPPAGPSAQPLGCSVSRHTRTSSLSQTGRRRVSDQRTGTHPTRGHQQCGRGQGRSNGRSDHSPLRAHGVFGARGARAIGDAPASSLSARRAAGASPGHDAKTNRPPRSVMSTVPRPVWACIRKSGVSAVGSICAVGLWATRKAGPDDIAQR